MKHVRYLSEENYEVCEAVSAVRAIRAEPGGSWDGQGLLLGYTWNGNAVRAVSTLPYEELFKLLFCDADEDMFDERGRPKVNNTLIDLRPWTGSKAEPWRPGDEARAIVRPEPIEPEIR